VSALPTHVDADWFHNVAHINGDQPAADGTPATFKRWTIHEMLSADLTFNWTAVGLMVAPTYGADSGELKTLKSYFADARAIALAAGLPVLNYWRVPERKRVHMFVAEGGRIPWTRRMQRMCIAYGIEPGDLEGWLSVTFNAAPLDSRLFRDTLRESLDEYGPHLVHLDPLYPFQPITISSSQLSQVGAMLNEVTSICTDAGASFWTTAHMNQTGTGFDLKRVTGAGVSEWADSWTLLKHRETPDVEAGKFWIEAEIGSRQWGGATFHIDWNIGRFDPETSMHDGDLEFTVTRPGQDGGMATELDLDLVKKIVNFLEHYEGSSANTIERAVGGNKKKVAETLIEMQRRGWLTITRDGAGKTAPHRHALTDLAKAPE
jgi:hypothetical protein